MATQCEVQTQPANMVNNQEPELPELSFRIATTENDKRDALRLVADSIAQQRQVASQAVIFHPLCLAAFAATSLLTWWLQASADLAGILIMQSGLIITYLAAVKYCTSSYIQRAEEFNWKSWIAGPDGKEDTVLVAQFGDDLIGTLALRLSRADKPEAVARAEIRAWTTRLKYRNKGIGGDLLREAVRHTLETLGDKAEVEFAAEHANAPLPHLATFNGGFVRREEDARRALQAVVMKQL